MNHPKPWRVRKETLPDALTELGLVWDIFDAADKWVASFKTEATALEIVRAVNAHDDLTAALVWIIAEFRPFANDNGPRERALDAALSALTLAKEKP